jgi:flagellar hook protein FlgE
MTAIPHAAEALTSALDRFGHASSRVLGAVTGASDADLGSALVDMSAAKTQFAAGVAVIRFSDEMWCALVDIGREPRDR